MDNQSKQFKALEAKWYKKLKDKGFDDAEKDGVLKRWHTHIFSQEANTIHVPVIRETKEEYYRIAGHFLNEYKFKNAAERHIWTWHSEGISVRDMAKMITRKGYKMKKSHVHNIVARLEEEMYKMYRPKND